MSLPENWVMPNSEDICLGHRGYCSFLKKKKTLELSCWTGNRVGRFGGIWWNVWNSGHGATASRSDLRTTDNAFCWHICARLSAAGIVFLGDRSSWAVFWTNFTQKHCLFWLCVTSSWYRIISKIWLLNALCLLSLSFSLCLLMYGRWRLWIGFGTMGLDGVPVACAEVVFPEFFKAVVYWWWINFPSHDCSWGQHTRLWSWVLQSGQVTSHGGYGPNDVEEEACGGS